MERTVKEVVIGRPAIDGAGVHLNRVISRRHAKGFDPFLMLDVFDSTNPEDYVAGFPFHPHRGIETLTYLVSGEIIHRDSLGNEGLIKAGEAQWMSAGSGIMHEEMPQPAERMLGFQLWLNIPAKDKMQKPNYQDLTAEHIGQVKKADYEVAILSGEFLGESGFTPLYVPAQVMVFTIKPGAEVEIPVAAEDNIFLFTLEGAVDLAGEKYGEKTALLLSPGELIKLQALDKQLRLLYFAAPKLEEEIAWGGPIVMNTAEELELAFQELEQGTFIKDQVDY